MFLDPISGGVRFLFFQKTHILFFIYKPYISGPPRAQGPSRALGIRRRFRTRTRSRTNSQGPTRAPPIAPREKIRRSGDPRCDQMSQIFSVEMSTYHLGASPRPPTPLGPKRAPIWDFWSFGPIFWVWEGFRIVQGGDWIHLDRVSGQMVHSRSSLDPFFFF